MKALCLFLGLLAAANGLHGVSRHASKTTTWADFKTPVNVNEAANAVPAGDLVESRIEMLRASGALAGFVNQKIEASEHQAQKEAREAGEALMAEDQLAQDFINHKIERDAKRAAKAERKARHALEHESELAAALYKAKNEAHENVAEGDGQIHDAKKFYNVKKDAARAIRSNVEELAKESRAAADFYNQKAAIANEKAAEEHIKDVAMLTKESRAASQFYKQKVAQAKIAEKEAAAEQVKAEKALLKESRAAAEFLEHHVAEVAHEKKAAEKELAHLDEEALSAVVHKFRKADSALEKQKHARKIAIKKANKFASKVYKAKEEQKAEAAKKAAEEYTKELVQEDKQAMRAVKKHVKNFNKIQVEKAAEKMKKEHAPEEAVNEMLAHHFHTKKTKGATVLNTESKDVFQVKKNVELEQKEILKELPVNQRVADLDGLTPEERALKLFEMRQELNARAIEQKKAQHNKRFRH